MACWRANLFGAGVSKIGKDYLSRFGFEELEFCLDWLLGGKFEISCLPSLSSVGITPRIWKCLQETLSSGNLLKHSFRLAAGIEPYSLSSCPQPVIYFHHRIQTD